MKDEKPAGQSDEMFRIVFGDHPLFFSTSIQDITERKLAEKVLMERGELLERIFDATHFSIVYLDKDFNFIRVNKAYADACGHPPEFFPGKNHFDLYPNEENEAIFRHVSETGMPFTIYAKPFEFPDHPERGVTYWDWTVYPVKSVNGTVEGLLFVLLDVTKNKKAEDALRENEIRFRAVFENSVDAIGVSKNGIHFFVNPAYLSLFGYTSADELVGRPIIDLIAREEREEILENVRRRSKGEFVPSFYETCGRRKDGTEFDMDVHVSAYALAGETYTLVILRDITERKRAEEALKESQRVQDMIIESAPT